MRAFVAVELDAASRELLKQLVERLKRSRVRASWVRPENVHMTICFLGEIDERQADRIGEALALGYRDWAPFTARLQGVGAFPNARRPSVIWAGLTSDLDAFGRVHAAADDVLRALGVRFDKRAFTPHVTLGRIRLPGQTARLAQLLGRETSLSGDEFQVSAVALFKSQLTPQGSIYTRLREFPFQWTSR